MTKLQPNGAPQNNEVQVMTCKASDYPTFTLSWKGKLTEPIPIGVGAIELGKILSNAFMTNVKVTYSEGQVGFIYT